MSVMMALLGICWSGAFCWVLAECLDERNA